MIKDGRSMGKWERRRQRVVNKRQVPQRNLPEMEN